MGKLKGLLERLGVPPEALLRHHCCLASYLSEKGVGSLAFVLFLLLFHISLVFIKGSVGFLCILTLFIPHHMGIIWGGQYDAHFTDEENTRS